MLAAGIDIGTTTISMIVLDMNTGEMKWRRTIEHRSFMEGIFPESRVQDPERISGFVSDAIVQMKNECGDISAIGLTGQMHGMLYVNSDGQAVSPLYTWQDGCGNRIIEDGKTAAGFLKEAVGNAAAGYGVTTHFFLQKKGLIPENACRMVTISDYIGMKLCGRKTPLLSADMAASWGCFDLQKLEFQYDRLDNAGVDISYLPEVSASYSVIGRTESKTPVVCSLGDNQASFVGSVRNRKDSLLINVGTGSQVSFGTQDYADCSGSVELRPCGDNFYLMTGSSLCGGRAYAMLEEFYRNVPGNDKETVLYDKMSAQAEDFLKKYGRDAAWDIYPVFSGTRSNPDECGRIGGIHTMNFHPGAMTAGMMLGILGELNGYYQTMRRLSGGSAVKLVGSGNGLRKNPLMRRLAEEMFGMKMMIPKYQEEAACGAALAALAATGGEKSLEEVCDESICDR